jgi:tetratricopeptide (TPR) repeat protein
LKLGLLKLGSTDSALNRWQSPVSIEGSLSLKFVAVARESGRLAKRSAQEAAKDGAPPAPRPIPFEIHQSIRLLKKAVRRYPSYAKAWVNLAAAYLAARKPAQALKVLGERPIQADSPEVVLLRGILLAEAKDYVGAAAAFEVAAVSDDVLRAVRYNVALLSEIWGREVEAKKAYQRYIETYPKGLWTQSAKRALKRF